MSSESLKIIFALFEGFLYFFCINMTLPKKTHVSIKSKIIHFVVISISVYLFLNDNLLSILLFNSILILTVYLIYKIEIYIASLSIIKTYIIILIASLMSTISAIFIYHEKLDYRFLLDSESINRIIPKIILTIIVFYLYKLFKELYNRKTKLNNINPRLIVFANTIYLILLILASSQLIVYLPHIYVEILKIHALSTLVSTGIIAGYISSLFMIYIINVYLFKRSDYLDIKLSSEIDELTGILNRKAGINYLKDRMRNIQLKKGVLTVCYLDVNNLKTVNDNYGHKEGDRLICKFSNLVKSTLRDGDEIARIGGDEFIIIFDQCKTESAALIWERISEKIDKFNLTSNLKYEISSSVGFSEYNHKMTISYNELLESADNEMYKNKEMYKKLKGISTKW